MSKTDMILKYLETHKKGITSLEAIEKFGATRLSAIIFNLKNQRGCNILTDMVSVKDRFGNKCRVARYTLVKE